MSRTTGRSARTNWKRSVTSASFFRYTGLAVQVAVSPTHSAGPMQRVNDEPFWRAQEKRRDRELGQPCCTQSGISWSLLDMPGRFAVVIHGEYDCVNCFRHNEGRSSWQYFSTRLTEGQLTSGDTAEPLQRCLELIAEHEQPDAIIVLGTCPVEVIGDQFDIVVDKVSAFTRDRRVPGSLTSLSGTRRRTSSARAAPTRPPSTMRARLRETTLRRRASSTWRAASRA